jgi:N-acyl homoserine lactone hydrolase
MSKTPDVRLYVFDGGRIKIDPDFNFSLFGITEGDHIDLEMAQPCFMVEHPNGRLLWEGGHPSSMADTPGWVRVDHGMERRLDRTVPSQLAELKLDMGSFDYVAFSHLHWDHAGLAKEIMRGTLIMQQIEYDLIVTDSKPKGHEKLYVGDMRSETKSLKKLLINGDHDVFGDGRVRLISAPGHVPGHQVLFVDLADYGPVVIGADLYHFRVTREKHLIPSVSADMVQVKESMDRVEQLLSETGGRLWIHHDPQLFSELKKAPAYYQ